MLLVEQLPAIVSEQVKAISNLKIDKITVWDSGRGADGNGGKGSTANFLSGLVGALPPLHELAGNVGVKLPGYLGAPATEKSAKPREEATPASPAEKSRA